MKLLRVSHVMDLLHHVGIEAFLDQLIVELEYQFGRWQEFSLTPRHAVTGERGVIELMPCHDHRHYAFKYVNGHPLNPRQGRLSVCALGVLADMESGYPMLLSEMTLLTACRTAAAAALASRYQARPDSNTLAMIGCGAQAEFVVQAMSLVLPICTVRYFDPDELAMTKFERNLAETSLALQPARDMKQALHDADVVVTATAARCHAAIITAQHLSTGCHYVGLGGDAPGKTEFTVEALKRCRIVVEYLAQTRYEGEIQQLSSSIVHAELWELVQGRKKGREAEDEITLFDSVGIALEDFAVLQRVAALADEQEIGEEADLIVAPADAKDLYGLLNSFKRDKKPSAKK